MLRAQLLRSACGASQTQSHLPIEVAPLSEYELKRSKNMAENDEVLRSLGLID